MDEVARFDVRAVSRFFASPKAGRKCMHALFLCPLFKSFEAYMFFTMLHYFHITCLIHQAWVFHLFKLVDIDSLPTSSEKQQLGGVAGLSMCMCTSLQVAHSCTTLPDAGCRWHVLKAVMRMGLSFGRSVQSGLVWQWELFLNEFQRDGLKWLIFSSSSFYVEYHNHRTQILCFLPAFNSTADSWQGSIQLWNTFTRAQK